MSSSPVVIRFRVKGLTRVVDRMTRLVEALTFVGKQRRLKKHERTLSKALAPLFVKQGRAVLKALVPLKGQITQAAVIEARLSEALDDDIGSAIDRALAGTADDMAEAIETTAKAAMTTGAGATAGDLGVTLATSFAVKNPDAAAYLAEYGANRVTQLSEETRRVIRELITRAIDMGKSYNRIAREIVDAFGDMSKKRAKLIAVTEAGNAYEHGSQAVAADMQREGLTMEKSWLTSNDDKVTPECMANQRQGWIPIKDTFASGHERPLRFPGCRCTALYRRKGAKD